MTGAPKWSSNSSFPALLSIPAVIGNARCFKIMEVPDRRYAGTQWIAVLDDLVGLETFPVQTSAGVLG